MMRSYLALAVLLFAADSAHAGQIEITFEFVTSTTVTAYGGQVQVPPQGSMTSGSGVLVVPGGTLVYALPGTTELREADFDLSVNALSLGANVAGRLAASQIGATSGNLSADLLQITLSGPLLLDAVGDLDCGGNFEMCSLLGSFPVSFAGTQVIPAGSMLTLSDVNLLGEAELAATLLLSTSDTTAVVDLIGMEVSRTYLPEPAGMAPLGAGIATLWLLSRRRRDAACKARGSNVRSAGSTLHPSWRTLGIGARPLR